MPKPYFSIIIPTYNRAHIILKTVHSVLNQTFCNWELIIVDDGSNDNTKDVILAIRDERIHYLFQKNAERSVARNNGIQNSVGKYICFLDSDDSYEPHHLETLYKNIQEEREPAALFFVHAYHIINGEKSLTNMVSLGNDPLLYFFTQPVIPARVCIHHEILKSIRFDEDIVIVEDLVLWTKIAYSYPVIEIKEYTVRYLLHEDNSVNIKNNSHYTRLLGLKKYFKRYPFILQKIPKKIRRRVISDTLFGVARYHNHVNAYLRMVKYLGLSIIKCPVHEQTKAKFHMMLLPSKHK